MSRNFCNTKEKGQGLVEYALILTLVAVVVIVILAMFGPAVGNVFSQITSSLDGGGGGALAGPVETEPVPVPTEPPLPTSGFAGWISTWNGCSGACNTLDFRCTPGTTWTIKYVASAYGGVTGTSPGHTCGSNGIAFAGNFYPEQQVTVVFNDNPTEYYLYTVEPHP